MKALVCGKCGDIRALMTTDWVSCECGNTTARWVDPRRGTAEFKMGDYPNQSYVLGLNNYMLAPALRGELAMWQDFRQAHDAATDAPLHIFDKSRAGCWAVIVRVGQTSDVKWEDDDA